MEKRRLHYLNNLQEMPVKRNLPAIANSDYEHDKVGRLAN